MQHKMKYHLMILSGVAFLPMTAIAQDDVEEDLQPMIERAEERIEYESDKMFRIGVGGTLGQAYNDNIYRAPNSEENDFITIFRPGIRVKSDMRPYNFTLNARMEVGEHWHESENSYLDTDVDARIGYDITPQTEVYAKARHRTDHVAIGAFTDSLDRQNAEPTDYNFGEASVGVKADTPSWLAHLNSGVNFYNYDNAARRDGTVNVNDDRDRKEAFAGGRLGYYVQPEVALYVYGSVNQRNYDNRVDSTVTIGRDSKGYKAMVGALIGEKRAPLYVNFAVGYLEQNYDNSALPDIGDLALEADVNWKPDELWRVQLGLDREVKETTNTGVSAYMQTRAQLRADHQLTDDWKLGARARFTHNNFEANQSIGGEERIDHIYDGGVYADYNFYEDYYIGGEYLRVSRNSDRDESDYDSNVFLLRLGVDY